MIDKDGLCHECGSSDTFEEYHGDEKTFRCDVCGHVYEPDIEKEKRLRENAAELYEVCKQLLWWCDTIPPEPSLCDVRKRAENVMQKIQN